MTLTTSEITETDTLVQIYEKYAPVHSTSPFTDKHTPMHNYLTYYDVELVELKSKPINLLEIGVCWGASMVLWNHYFNNPETRFYGLDITADYFENPESKSKSILEKEDRVKFQFGISSTDTKHSKTYEDSFFDLIFEDGAHDLETQFETFKNYFPKLKADGVYYLEDILCEGNVSSLISLIDNHTNNGVNIEVYRGGEPGWRLDDIILKIVRK